MPAKTITTQCARERGVVLLLAGQSQLVIQGPSPDSSATEPGIQCGGGQLPDSESM